jgi:hypothetical protein
MEIDFDNGDVQVVIRKAIFHWKNKYGSTHLKVTCLVCK